jgi:hypothetical protein
LEQHSPAPRNPAYVFASRAVQEHGKTRDQPKEAQLPMAYGAIRQDQGCNRDILRLSVSAINNAEPTNEKWPTSTPALKKQEQAGYEQWAGRPH